MRPSNLKPWICILTFDLPVAEPVVVVEVLGAREAELDCCGVKEGEEERSGKSPTPCTRAHVKSSQCSVVSQNAVIK